jgi:hypothetical protein
VAFGIKNRQQHETHSLSIDGRNVLQSNPFATLREKIPTHRQSGVENHLMLCPISFQLPSVLMLKKK